MRSYYARLEPFFHFLWAWAVLEDRHVRIPWGNRGLPLALELLAIAAGISVLCNPRSRKLFGILCLLSSINLLYAWPEMANASLIILTMNLALLAAIVQGEGYLSGAAGSALLILGIAYFAAGFHKLNAGFFSPKGSCAGGFFSAELGWSWPPSVYLAVATVVTEFSLPVLLWSRRTRSYGLILGAVFHLMIGLVIETFSSAMLCLYLLLLCTNSSSDWLSFFEKATASRTRKIALKGAMIAAMVLQYWFGRKGFPYHDYGLVRLAWVLLALAASSAVFWFAVRSRPFEFSPIARPSLCGNLIALFLILNSTGPYVGFRSTLAFSMYSNLRVEGESNHWLIPKGAAQFFFEGDDLVTILWSDLPVIQSLGLGRWEIPRLELARILEDGRKYHISFSVFTRYQGRSGWVTPADPGPFRQSNYPYWKAKFFSYRPVPPSGVNRCIW